MKKIGSLIALFVVCFAVYPALFAQTKNAKPTLVSVNSRAELVKAFGKETADNVPGYFDFKKFKLVAVTGEKTGNTVSIKEPRRGASPFLTTGTQVKYEKNKATLLVFTDPFACIGGIKKRNDARLACQAAQRARVEKEAKTIVFYAFPKNTKVNLTYRKITAKPQNIRIRR